MNESGEVYVSFDVTDWRTLFPNVERRASEMIDKEKLNELKNSSELILELIGTIEESDKACSHAISGKQHYMDEYKKMTDKYHKLRKRILDSGCDSCKLFLVDL